MSELLCWKKLNPSRTTTTIMITMNVKLAIKPDQDVSSLYPLIQRPGDCENRSKIGLNVGFDFISFKIVSEISKL